MAKNNFVAAIQYFIVHKEQTKQMMYHKYDTGPTVFKLC